MSDRVTCVTKGDSHRYSDCRCISVLGTATGQRLSRERAHDMLVSVPGSLYIESYGTRTSLIPVSRDGIKYVRSAPNDTTADNLLSLSSC